MMKRDSFFSYRFIRFGLLLFLLFLIGGCDPEMESVDTGVFLDSPVSGLTYKAATFSGKTGSGGEFNWKVGETITFSIGGLVLGSAAPKKQISPIDIVEGAKDATDQRVNNICVLLQTLDADEELNNGIQISRAISSIVDKHAVKINFDQTVAAFAADPEVTALLAELNSAKPAVFKDTDPRPRLLRKAVAAREHLQRSLSPRKTVATKYGKLSGFAPNQKSWAFYGIPYAQPPVGNLRWKAPAAPKSWKGVRQAVAWGDQAAQSLRYENYGEGGMSEDCLYLNVTTPKNARKLPVMVWFHGGGFSILTGNTKAFNNAASLPTKGVILVTVCHRLGPFGYLAHPLLSEESGYDGSGNYGQMDLIAALKWVRENIAAFGGDPKNVTIFGESGGGGKVISLMASELAKGLFHKAICQSGMGAFDGGAMDSGTLESAEAKGVALLGETKTLKELRALPWTEIIAMEEALVAGGSTLASYTPNIDNHYATKSQKQSVIDGLPNDVPFISGANTGDMPPLIEGFLNQMPIRAQYCKAPQYTYLFDQVPAGWRAKGVKAYHGIELVYVFNDSNSFMPHYLLGLTGIDEDPATEGSQNTPAGFMANPTGYGAEDTELSDKVMTMWSNFAKSGNPGIKGVIEWPAYTPENDNYLKIAPTLEVKTGLQSAFELP